MTQAQAATVRHHIVVDAAIERAFSTFTERLGDFKPPEHNLLGVAIAETVFEPRVGGHIYDRGVDGTECRWARVLAYEPPNRVVFSWDVSPQWQIEPDPGNTSEVEVRHRRDPNTNAGDVGAPPPRPTRPRLASGERRRGRRGGLAAVPAAFRRPADRSGLTLSTRLRCFP
jgi:uncharacterized protein YndB with AHSA1/START domain